VSPASDCSLVGNGHHYGRLATSVGAAVFGLLLPATSVASAQGVELGPEIVASVNTDGGHLRVEPSAVIRGDTVVVAWNDSRAGRDFGVPAGVGIAWSRSLNGGRAEAAGITFSLQVAEDAGLYADADALRQILTNLFDNALRHTPGGGRIQVEMTAVDDGTAVSVSDTGSGIAAEHLPRVFERFYRADPARSRSQGGTGLGLSIVKHLVEAHGARIDLTSALGRGTTIRMVFPHPRGART